MLTLDDFDQIIFADFEFVARPGERPDVVCLAWHELPAGKTHRLWRNELGDTPPYRIDDRVLFVCFVANAELGCHLARGWPLPAHVLDLSPEFRGYTNGRLTPEGKGLLGALAYFDIPSISSKQKDGLRRRIMKGWPFTAEEREEILAYCASDVDVLPRLLDKLAPSIDLDVALYRGEFVAASAVMEFHGVPNDMSIFPRLADKRAWRYVRDAMVPAIDAAYGVYIKDKAGDWHFRMERFQQYLDREGIVWPLTDKGKLSTKRKTFENMTKGHPQLEALRQLRHARDKMRQIRLAVGADGRNRTVLWPFQSKSSRSQPKASQWIFSPAVWLRSLIKPEPGRNEESKECREIVLDFEGPIQGQALRVAAKSAAILDRHSTRWRSRTAVGAEEWLRRGQTKECAQKQVSCQDFVITIREGRHQFYWHKKQEQSRISPSDTVVMLKTCRRTSMGRRRRTVGIGTPLPSRCRSRSSGNWGRAANRARAGHRLSAMEGRPSAAGKPSSRQPVTQSGPPLAT